MNINDVIVQGKTRKRGRPRKNSNIILRQKPVNEHKNNLLNDDIIIHFPISSKEVNSEKINGFELIQTECTDTIENDELTENSSDDEQIDMSQKYNKMIQILKDRDERIAELESKLSTYEEHIVTTHELPQNTKLYMIDMPFDKNADGHIIVPEHTCNACLWDTCNINGMPYFLPDKYYDGKFYVIGWFCSLNCAMAYNLSLDDSKVSERYSLLKWLYGKTQETIEPSPPCRILDKYGGKISIDVYRKNLNKCDVEYGMIMSPMISIPQTLDERIQNRRKKCTTINQTTIMDAMKHKTKKTL